MITQSDVEQLIQLLQKVEISSSNGDSQKTALQYLFNAISRPAEQEEFDGELDLSNTSGVLYTDHTQTEDVTLSVGEDPVVGGWAMIKIIASGDAITVPGAWIQYGGDAISVVVDDENHLQVYYKDADTIYYTNKVV